MARKARARQTGCRWCGKSHDYSETLCFVKNERAIRSRYRPRVKKAEEVYDDQGKIRSEFLHTDMEDKLLARQMKLAEHAFAELNGEVPRNARVFVAQGFVWNQIAVENPWAVYVIMDGKRKRKRFNNLRDAILFYDRAKKAGYSAGIVSMRHRYDLPPEYRSKLSKLPRKFKWCPCCADFRVFKKREPAQRFYAMVKRWSTTKNRYEWVDRQLWVTECQLCGCPNTDSVFRRANTPWDTRPVKQGRTRMKPRVSTKRVAKTRERGSR